MLCLLNEKNAFRRWSVGGDIKPEGKNFLHHTKTLKGYEYELFLPCDYEIIDMIKYIIKKIKKSGDLPDYFNA